MVFQCDKKSLWYSFDILELDQNKSIYVDHSDQIGIQAE